MRQFVKSLISHIYNIMYTRERTFDEAHDCGDLRRYSYVRRHIHDDSDSNDNAEQEKINSTLEGDLYTFIATPLGPTYKTKPELRHIKRLNSFHPLIKRIIDAQLFKTTPQYTPSAAEQQEYKRITTKYIEITYTAPVIRSANPELFDKKKQYERLLKDKPFKPLICKPKKIPEINCRLLWPLQCIPLQFREEHCAVINSFERVIISIESPLFQIFYTLDRNRNDLNSQGARDMFFHSRIICNKDYLVRQKLKEVPEGKILLLNPVTLERAQYLCNEHKPLNEKDASRNAREKFLTRFGDQENMEDFYWFVNYPLRGISAFRMSKNFEILIIMIAGLNNDKRKTALHRVLNFLVYMNSCDDQTVRAHVARKSKK